MTIAPESPDQPEVIALIAELDAYQDTLYPPESRHALDLASLKQANVLFFVARDDMVTPLYFTEELVRLIPDAHSYVLPDGGHFFPNVHAEEFRRVITSFLLES